MMHLAWCAAEQLCTESWANEVHPVAKNLSSMLSISLVHQAVGYQDMYQAKPTLHQTNVVKKLRLAVYQHGECVALRIW